MVKNCILKNNTLTRKKSSEVQYLKELILIIKEFQIFVFEFTEQASKKKKANFDGFFINPYLIVVNKNSYNRKREIFTLLHEFAHFLLNIKEIDLEILTTSKSINDVEKWCHDFSYYFLIEGYERILNSLDYNENPVYCERKVKEVAERLILVNSQFIPI